MTERALENVRQAVACGADLPMALTVLFTSARPSTVEEARQLLEQHGDAIASTLAQPDALELRELEPDLRYAPELAGFRLERDDHAVRDRLLFGELLGKKRFFQMAAFEIAGLDLGERDAELLEHVGVATQIADPRVWPLGVTRRIAAGGGSLAHATLGGLAALCTERMAVLPVAGFMRFLDRVTAEQTAGRTVAEVVDDVIARRDRVLGLGRPALSRDERIPPMLALYERFGRRQGASLELALELDAAFAERKGLRVNSAGIHGAVMRDMGFSPDAAGALCLLYFLVPVLAHAVYPAEVSRR